MTIRVNASAAWGMDPTTYPPERRVYQGFNVPDSATTLPVGWTQLAGTWGTIGGQAYTSVATADSLATWQSATAANDVIGLRLPAGSAAFGIAFRVVDASNFLLFTGAGDLWKRVAGVYTQLATGPTVTAGEYAVYTRKRRQRVEQVSTGIVWVEYDLTEAEDGTFAQGSKSGMWIDNSTTVRLDDFVKLGWDITGPVRACSIRRSRPRQWEPNHPAQSILRIGNESQILDPAHPGASYGIGRRDGWFKIEMDDTTPQLLILEDAVGQPGRWTGILATVDDDDLVEESARNRWLTSGILTTSTAGNAGMELTNPVAATPGTTYTFVAGVLPITVARSVKLDIDWRDTAGAVISTSTTTVGPGVLGRWTDWALTAVAPAGTVTMRPRILHVATALNEVHYVGTFSLHAGTGTVMRHPRIATELAGSTHDIMTGHTSAFSNHYPANGDAYVEITFDDPMRLMISRPLWPSVAEHAYLGGYNGARPLHYWPLDEVRGDDRFETMRDMGTDPTTRLVSQRGLATGLQREGTGGRLVWEKRPLQAFSGGATEGHVQQVITGTPWIAAVNGPWTLELVYFQSERPAAGLFQFLTTESTANGNTGRAHSIYITDDGVVHCRIHFTDGTSIERATPAAAKGKVHMVAMGVETGDVFAYLDGAFAGSTLSAKTINAPDEFLVGTEFDKTTSYFKGEIGRIAIFNYRRVQANNIQPQWDTYNLPWDADATCGARVDHLLRNMEDFEVSPAWPSNLTWVPLTGGRKPLPMTGGGSIGAYLQRMALTEGGDLRADQWGRIAFWRESDVALRPVMGTYSTDRGAGRWPCREITVEGNDDTPNKVKVSIDPFEAKVTRTDDVAMNRFGEQAIEITTASRTLADAEAIGDKIIARNAEARRIYELSVALADPDIPIPIAMHHQPGDRIRVEVIYPAYSRTAVAEILDVAYDLEPGGRMQMIIRALEEA